MRIEPLAVEVGLGLVKLSGGRRQFATTEGSRAFAGNWQRNSDISFPPFG